MASKEKELILNEEEDILLFMLLRRNRAKKKFSNRKRKVWVRHVFRGRNKDFELNRLLSPPHFLPSPLLPSSPLPSPAFPPSLLLFLQMLATMVGRRRKFCILDRLKRPQIIPFSIIFRLRLNVFYLQYF